MTPRVAIDPSVGNPANFRERWFLTTAATAAIVASDWPTETDIVIVSAHRKHTRWPVFSQVRPRPLVLAIGDESGKVNPFLRNNASVLFQQYVAEALPKVRRLPLGPGGPPTAPDIPWNARTYDILFVGHLHRKRWPLARQLGLVPQWARLLPNDVLAMAGIRSGLTGARSFPGISGMVQFTDAFGHGVPYTAFIEMLHKTRIALVPPGFRQNETFRHYEAARAGCVLLGAAFPTAGPPVVPMAQNLVAQIQDMLAHPDTLYQQHVDVHRHWKHHLQPEILAQRLTDAAKVVHLSDR